MVKRSSDRSSRRGAAILWLLVVLGLLAAGGFFVWGRRDQKEDKELALSFVAAKEKLRVSVVEAGQLKAARSVDIYCKVPLRRTPPARLETSPTTVPTDALHLLLLALR